MSSWEELAEFLTSLPPEDLDRFSRHAALELSAEPKTADATLRAYADENPDATPSVLLSSTASQAGFAGEEGFARRMGSAALELAETDEERQLAHVSLAQVHFRNRREEEELAAFERHCRAAVELGHAGTFCYERLATLYEYRGEIEDAISVCLRAVEALGGVGDRRSAERFGGRLERLYTKSSPNQPKSS